MKVTGQFTVPILHKSGSALTVDQIANFSLTRNGVEIQKLPAAEPGSVVTFTDATPLTGSDTYDVFTIDADGFISDVSNDAAVVVPEADPAAAVTDLTAAVSAS